MDAIDHFEHYQGCSEIGREILSSVIFEYEFNEECIYCIESWDFGFHCGNAVKYLWRAGSKGDFREDLKKARWYLERYLNSEKDEDISPHIAQEMIEKINVYL